MKIIVGVNSIKWAMFPNQIFKSHHGLNIIPRMLAQKLLAKQVS